ncbi:MAG: flagellar biosynthesis anti-sigma factor FlgM [Nitrospinales bacterium]
MKKPHDSQVNVSEKALELKLAREIALNTPDVCKDVVKEVQSEIEEGRFRINSEAVADKILQDLIKS